MKTFQLHQNLLCNLLFLFFTTPSFAAVYTVSNGNDAGAGSLRDAVIQANATVGADVINVNSSVFIINLSTYNSTFFTGNLEQLNNVTLNGNGVIIQSTVDSYLTDFGPGAIINDVTFYNFKYAVGAVSCPNITDVVMFNNCSFNNNSNFLSFYQQGGALVIGNTLGNVYFLDCTFSYNSAEQGGAIYMYGLASSSNATFDGCNFDNNSSTTTVINKGNAIYAECGAILTLTGLTSFDPIVEQDVFGKLNNEGCVTIPFTLAAGFTLNIGDVMRIHYSF